MTNPNAHKSEKIPLISPRSISGGTYKGVPTKVPFFAN